MLMLRCAVSFACAKLTDFSTTPQQRRGFLGVFS